MTRRAYSAAANERRNVESENSAVWETSLVATTFPIFLRCDSAALCRAHWLDVTGPKQFGSAAVATQGAAGNSGAEGKGEKKSDNSKGETRTQRCTQAAEKSGRRQAGERRHAPAAGVLLCHCNGASNASALHSLHASSVAASQAAAALRVALTAAVFDWMCRCDRFLPSLDLHGQSAAS